DAGAMLAVKEEVGKVEAVLKHFPRVTIANLNSPRQVVLAGPAVEIAKVRQTLQEQGYTAILLPVSAAFHTPLIAFAQKAFAQAIKSISFQNPKIPVYTNVTGKQYPKEAADIQRILETHLSNAVLFKQEIENIYAEGGSCFVEFGPKKILTGLVKDILGDRPHLTVALNPSSQKDSDRSLREAVVQLRVAGSPLKNLDPYQLPQPIPVTEKSKGLRVPLNGINYVSEKTKMAFEQALQDGHKVKLPASTSENNAHIDSKSLSATLTTTPTATVAETNGHTNKSLLPVNQKIEDKGTRGTRGPHGVGIRGEGDKSIQNSKSPLAQRALWAQIGLQETSAPTSLKIQNLESSSTSSSPSTSPTPPLSSPQPIPQPTMQTSPDTPANDQQVLASLEYVLTQFQQNQSESLQVHGHYLNHQMEYAKTFFQLMQQQNSLFANNKPSDEAAKLKPVLIESLERSMMQFHAQQGETLRVHEQYLNTQVEHTKNFFQLIQQEYSQLVSSKLAITQPVVSSRETTAANKKRERLIALDTTLTKQDSPVPPIHQIPTTEEQPIVNKMDAQLHSVVEVGTQTQIPKATDFVSANEFSVSPTNNLSVTSVTPSVIPLPISSPVVTETVTVTTETVPTDSPTTSSGVSIDLTDLDKNLLAIISDKTGYPVEMLDVNMDMEADLGIDSIKRVEILGTMQEMYPDLPKPNVEELGELRTIGQIVEYLQSSASPIAAKSIAVETAISIQEDVRIQEE
ncbi:MAG: acyltransferase domain-containing protein, partial [Brasilonema sp.]